MTLVLISIDKESHKKSKTGQNWPVTDEKLRRINSAHSFLSQSPLFPVV
jgi:hypothetical protein